MIGKEYGRLPSELIDLPADELLLCERALLAAAETRKRIADAPPTPGWVKYSASRYVN